jgi:hypothetical protein
MDSDNRNKFFSISDISLLSGSIRSLSDVAAANDCKVFSDPDKFGYFDEAPKESLAQYVDSPLRKRMSGLSIGIYACLNQIKSSITPDEQMYLFSGCAEIETTNKIIKAIINEQSSIVSPTLFHNSVHNTPLGYFTVINKMHNYCTTVSDGLDTNKSFADFLRLRIQLPGSFIATAGEDSSEFYSLDTTRDITIRPAYIAYRITPSKRGISILDRVNDLDKIDYSMYQNVITDKATFDILNGKVSHLYTDWAITADMPCSLVFRLAMHNILGWTGRTLVIDKTVSDDSWTLFEVSNEL